MVFTRESTWATLDEWEFNLTLHSSINSCSNGGNAQLNVRNANRDIGAEVITWVTSPDAAHAQFILKAI
jgi:hypothetical protein